MGQFVMLLQLSSSNQNISRDLHVSFSFPMTKVHYKVVCLKISQRTESENLYWVTYTFTLHKFAQYPCSYCWRRRQI